MLFRRAAWLICELFRNEVFSIISFSNLFYGTNSLCLLHFFFWGFLTFLTWLCLILRSFMGILSWHKPAEWLKEAVSIPHFLPGWSGPGLVLPQPWVNPLQNQPQKQQNEISPGSVPRCCSWHSCMKGNEQSGMRNGYRWLQVQVVEPWSCFQLLVLALCLVGMIFVLGPFLMGIVVVCVALQPKVSVGSSSWC